MPRPTQTRIVSTHAGTNLMEVIGLQAWEGHPELMPAAHRHNELELNLVARGTAVYFFGDRRVTLEAGSLMLFWAIMPHQLVEATPDNHMYWLTLPLSWFLHGQWPASFRRRVLNSELVFDPTACMEDTRLFTQWQADLTRSQPQDHEVVLLEAEARLKRLAYRLEGQNQGDPPRPPARISGAAGLAGSAHPLNHAEKIAAFLASHFREDLQVEAVAAHASLHPNYAMEVFRKAFGLTMIEYLTTLRVAHAQQLLVNSDQNVLQIALDAGFGSVSQFYVAFKRLCGTSPRRYRASLR